jgi:acylphosphatase
MNKCYEISLEGRVQGVGFRNFAFTKALKYGIKGYVKNTFEGNVEIVCCGNEESLDKFISDIKKGPSFSFISKFTINNYNDTENFKDFRITY